MPVLTSMSFKCMEKTLDAHTDKQKHMHDQHTIAARTHTGGGLGFAPHLAQHAREDRLHALHPVRRLAVKLRGRGVEWWATCSAGVDAEGHAEDA